ncbi:LysR family transcriptional regulator [Nitratireductor pacificus]|uniref:LysR family transcriptional regulator n=1 Tax=Nitratireductor pacificus pht-3B TaxID=391937 RepID=K2LLV9_9HYPH|nr:LysR family transcriptional regulator [Nitratireductor pacificus]EKF18749.1 LysR family transcriptional regulator [Nitratireductor pacificus pht-3B]
MARIDVNRSAEMEVFVRVVEMQSFSAAARALRMTPSAVSKLIGRLEARLGTRLVRRSTRRLQVTPEGNAFYESGVRILADMAAAEREAAAGAAPRGRLRINSNVPFGQHRLIPLVPKFLARHPEVAVDLVLTDHVVDLLEERADLAIRAGPLADSSLIVRKLGQTRMAVVASPAYLEAHGRPRTPADLAAHNLLGFCFSRIYEGWPFTGAEGQIVTVPATGRSLISDGETMRLMALAGAGIARHALWHVGPDIAAGRLVPLLEEHNPGDEEAVHAVYVGQGRFLPARVRAFLDFLAEAVNLDDTART